MACMLWMIIGFDLAFHKGQFDRTVNWIGYSLTCDSSRVVANIK